MAVNSFREDEYMENTDKKKILSRLLSYLFDYKLPAFWSVWGLP